MKWRLIVLNGPQKGHAQAGHPGMTIGRTDASDFVIESEAISQCHARIVQNGTSLYLEDLDSTNGTQFNGEDIQRTRIKHGDTFVVGDTQVRVEATKTSPRAIKPVKPSARPKPRRLVATPRSRKKQDSGVWRIFLVAGIVLAIGILVFVSSRMKTKPMRRPVVAAVEEEEEIKPDPAMLARESYAEARQWASEHPDDHSGIIARYQKLAELHPDTPSARAALAAISKIERTREQELRQAMYALDHQSDTLVQNKEYEKAIALYEQYSGDFSDETAEARMLKVEAIRARLAEHTVSEEADSLTEALVVLLEKGIEEAGAWMSRNPIGERDNGSPDGWDQLADLLASARSAPGTVLESFNRQADQTIAIEFTSGARRLHIAGTAGNRVKYYKKVGSAKVIDMFSLGSLSTRERRKRAGVDAGGLALLNAMSAIKQKKYADAEQHFAAAPSPLRERILKQLEDTKASMLAEVVEQQFIQALRLAGLNARSANDFGSCLSTLKEEQLPTGTRLVLYAIARDIQNQSPDAPWVKSGDMADLLGHLTTEKPSFEDDMATAAVAVAEEDEEAPPSKTGVDWRTEIDF